MKSVFLAGDTVRAKERIEFYTFEISKGTEGKIVDDTRPELYYTVLFKNDTMPRGVCPHEIELITAKEKAHD